MVSAIRPALITDDATLATIDRQSGGYRLRIVDATFDLDRFDELVARARDASTPAAVAGSLRAALDQWHGPTALGGVQAAFVGRQAEALGVFRAGPVPAGLRAATGGRRPDIVLMDVWRPGTDGLTATERIVPLGPRVVVLTTFDFDQWVYRALRAGAHGFLLKDTPPAWGSQCERTRQRLRSD